MTDIEIAQQASPLPIREIAAKLGILDEELEPYGHKKAKVSLSVLERLKDKPDGKLILVTALTPTAAGEGKSTVTVGLGQGFAQLGKNACIALREPSLGPCFGIKGGAAGGGFSQVIPMEDINLHFTGDIHAIGTANNLLAAMLDNHICHGNELGIDVRQIILKRAMDLNERALRDIVVGLGGTANGYPREDGFEITVASEVMAIHGLATSQQDLKERLSRIIVARKRGGEPITSKDLQAEGSMTLLLKDALKPNLVQTLENTPAFVHGGPFANIAHGCNSILATRTALKLADILVTEAGFGADLGAEKFLDIKCRAAGLMPNAVVLVATIRALKMHGGAKKDELQTPNVEQVKRGLPNLLKHAQNISLFKIPPIIAINKFKTDTEEEIDCVVKAVKEAGYAAEICDVWGQGGKGALVLGETVLKSVDKPSAFEPLYPLEMSIKEKLETIATKIYGADGVNYTPEAEKRLAWIDQYGYSKLPVCVAKTQYSLSDDPALLCRPSGFKVTVRDLKVSAGAGFVVAYTGTIMTMPGLPKRPAAEKIDIDENGVITGLF